VNGCSPQHFCALPERVVAGRDCASASAPTASYSLRPAVRQTPRRPLGLLRMGASGREQTQAVICTASNEPFANAGEAIALAPNLAEDHLALALICNRSAAHNPHGGP
jgi:hypothetical protein